MSVPLPTPYNRVQPDQLDEIRIRLRISNLAARLAMHEIEIAALGREIDSHLTSFKRRVEAAIRRDAQHADWWQIKAELDELRRSYPRFARH